MKHDLVWCGLMICAIALAFALHYQWMRLAQATICSVSLVVHAIRVVRRLSSRRDYVPRSKADTSD